MNKVLAWRKAIQASALPSTAKLVLLNLSIHMNDEGGCFPSTARQAKDTGLSERAVCTHLERAEKAGYIDKRLRGYSGKRWKKNEYKALIPEGTERCSVAQTDNQMQGTEPRSAANHQGTEPDDTKALNHVQSNSPLNSTEKETIPKLSDEYFYAGQVIRLNERDFMKWKGITGISTEALAETLDSRDTWLAGQPENRRRAWFLSTERYLIKEFHTHNTKEVRQ
jgi:DNA-binding transcriptional ArsR family regulator